MQRLHSPALRRGRKLPSSPDAERIARLYALVQSVNRAISDYHALRCTQSYACPLGVCIPINESECPSCSVAVPC